MSEREEALKLARDAIDGGGCCNSVPLARALIAEHERATKLSALLAQACDQIDACSTWENPSDAARKVLRGVAGVIRERAARAMEGES